MALGLMTVLLVIQIEQASWQNAKAQSKTESVISEKQITDEQQELLNKLILCESNNREEAIGDSGKARGILQFWFGTFKEGVRKYDLLPYTEEIELPNLWTDNYVQTELAKRMLLDGGWKHWLNCGKKIGLDKFNG